MIIFMFAGPGRTSAESLNFTTYQDMGYNLASAKALIARNSWHTLGKPWHVGLQP